MWYTPWIVSEHVPDLSTLKNLIDSPRFAGKIGQDLAVALWELIVDRDLGIFHYFPARENFWQQDVYDPLKILNVYGFTICHCHAHMLAMIYREAGMDARIADIRGHEGTEVHCDGGWHYLDCDLQGFHRLRPPSEHVIASREQLYQDPTLVSDQPNPSNPYFLPDRLPEQIQNLYTVKPSWTELKEEHIHSMDFVLRPGATMTRYFHHRGRWVVFDNYAFAFKRFAKETSHEGPTERFWPRRTYGNGLLHYAPKLLPTYRDVELGADSLDGLALTDAGLTAKDDGGTAVFAFESPYIFCGVPDQAGRVPSYNGALVRATFDLPAGASARIDAAPERSEAWRELWHSGAATGQLDAEVDFTALAEAQYRLRLRFVLHGAGATLKHFETSLWFMVSPHSLPALRSAGANRMHLHCGDQFGLNTRPFLLEYKMEGGNDVPGAHATENLRYAPQTYSRLLPVDPARDWEAIYRVTAPNGGKMAWLRAFTVIEGRKPDEPYDGHEATISVAESADGPWEKIAAKPIVEHEMGWHFGLFGQARLSGKSEHAYVKFAARKGAIGFRIAGHYLPSSPPVADSRLEVEHVWYEVDPKVGRRERRHVEPITRTDHEYSVQCAHEPHDEAIILRVPSLAR